MLKQLLWIVAPIATTLVAYAPAQASIQFDFNTPAGATNGGQPVNATATVAIPTDGAVVITLKNLFGDPKSVAQAVSGFFIQLSTGMPAAGSFVNQFSPNNGNKLIDIDGPGFQDSGISVSSADANVTWNYDGAGGILITSIGNMAGSPTIIGPPGYASANPSITGSKLFILEEATFTLDVPGVKMNGTEVVGTPAFAFGTDGALVPVAQVPEPVSIITWLGLLGIGFLFGFKRWKTQPHS